MFVCSGKLTMSRTTSWICVLKSYEIHYGGLTLEQLWHTTQCTVKFLEISICSGGRDAVRSPVDSKKNRHRNETRPLSRSCADLISLLQTNKISCQVDSKKYDV